jgi:hypothetical protein
MVLGYCGNFILSVELILLNYTKLKLHVNVLSSLGLFYYRVHSVPATNVKVHSRSRIVCLHASIRGLTKQEL